MSSTTTPQLATRQDPAALVWARERSGYSQAALAREIQVSRSLLCRIEAGDRNATPDVLGRIAKALNCPVSVLERKRESAA